MNDKNVITTGQRFLSRKFIFALVSFILCAGLLLYGSLPSDSFETISIAIVMSYLSSNVATRFVDNKFSGSSEFDDEDTNEDGCPEDFNDYNSDDSAYSTSQKRNPRRRARSRFSGK